MNALFVFLISASPSFHGIATGRGSTCIASAGDGAIASFYGDMTNTVKRTLEAFEKYWRKNNAKNPEIFPMEFGKDNTGMWQEQFNSFLRRIK